jgi:hypothetical protein
VLAEAERVKTVIRSLPEASLRVAYFRDYLSGVDSAERAPVLDAICEAGARADPSVRETVLALVMFLAGVAEARALDELGRAAAELRLMSLGRLLRRAPELDSVERPSLVPNYGAGRELTLGERKTLARRPNRKSFDKLLLDPDPTVITQLLGNPRLTEDDVLRVAARRPANVAALRAIARTPWLCRGRIRMSLIHNPGTPSSIAVPLLAACTRPELSQIRTSSEASIWLRDVADELLTLRA